MGFIKHRLFFLAISFGFIQWGCNTPNENLPLVTYEWVRFEQLFYDNSDDSLEELQSTYPYFFPEDTPIQVWKQKQKDSLQRALFKATQTIPIEKTDQELPRLLGRYKNIFPDATLPEKMVTLISDVDYNHKIILEVSVQNPPNFYRSGGAVPEKIGGAERSDGAVSSKKVGAERSGRAEISKNFQNFCYF